MGEDENDDREYGIDVSIDGYELVVLNLRSCLVFLMGWFCFYDRKEEIGVRSFSFLR